MSEQHRENMCYACKFAKLECGTELWSTCYNTESPFHNEKLIDIESGCKLFEHPIYSSKVELWIDKIDDDGFVGNISFNGKSQIIWATDYIQAMDQAQEIFRKWLLE